MANPKKERSQPCNERHSFISYLVKLENGVRMTLKMLFALIINFYLLVGITKPLLITQDCCNYFQVLFLTKKKVKCWLFKKRIWYVFTKCNVC